MTAKEKTRLDKALQGYDAKTRKLAYDAIARGAAPAWIVTLLAMFGPLLVQLLQKLLEEFIKNHPVA